MAEIDDILARQQAGDLIVIDHPVGGRRLAAEIFPVVGGDGFVFADDNWADPDRSSHAFHHVPGKGEETEPNRWKFGKVGVEVLGPDDPGAFEMIMAQRELELAGATGTAAREQARQAASEDLRLELRSSPVCGAAPERTAARISTGGALRRPVPFEVPTPRGHTN